MVFQVYFEVVQENTLPCALLDTVDATLKGLGESAALLSIDVQGQTQRYLVHHWTLPTAAVFGAGHVGLALVDVLQHALFRIQLIDDRQDRIPQSLARTSMFCTHGPPRRTLKTCHR